MQTFAYSNFFNLSRKMRVESVYDRRRIFRSPLGKLNAKRGAYM